MDKKKKLGDYFLPDFFPFFFGGCFFSLSFFFLAISTAKIMRMAKKLAMGALEISLLTK